MTGRFTPTPSPQTVTNSFTDVAVGTWAQVRGYFNISLSGNGVGTYKLQKTYDNGATAIDVCKNADGDVMSFDKLTAATLALLCYEPESDVKYRWNCTADTSGTTTARISQ